MVEETRKTSCRHT